MAIQKAMISSRTNEWETPQWLFDVLDNEFHFTLDPCCQHNTAKCGKHYTIMEDGLSHDWSQDIVFMNPPYGGRTGLWIQKAYDECKKGSIVVCLIVSSTDRSYWHDIIFPFATQIRFIRGRIKFGEAKSTAPFASAIVVFDNKHEYSERYISCKPKPIDDQLFLFKDFNG
jgi:site-specific DNA-methyltransferase (adenine-specific)